MAHLTDLFLFDVKHLDAEQHRAWTGRHNAALLSNLRKLAAMGRNIVVRMPVISGFNDDPAHATRLGAWMRESSLDRMSLLAFHGLGGSKYEQVAGQAWGLAHLVPPQAGRLAELASAFREQNVACRIEGLPVT